ARTGPLHQDFPMAFTKIDRRQFLVTTGALAGASCVGLGRTEALSLVSAPDDAVASAAPARWALGELRDALVERGVTVRVHERIEQAAADERCILLAGTSSPAAREVLQHARVTAVSAPESLALAAGKSAGKDVVLVSVTTFAAWSMRRWSWRIACGMPLTCRAR
ncbi:MAG: hypothetical protein ACRD2X_21770, partial [Vicinamibacteraceae bacterium]